VTAVLRHAARRFIAIDGYDRGLALAAQAFVAVVPLLVVVASWSPSGAGSIAGGLGLERPAADAVRALVARPPGPAEPLTIVGLAVLVLSVLGFARTMQRTFEAAWDLPRSGLRGYGPGLLGAAAFVGEVIGLVVLARLLAPLHPPGFTAPLLWTVAATLVWWPVQRLLVGGRVPWRDLAPGAAVTGAGQAVVMGLASVAFEPALARQQERFGALGVAATIVTGLTVLGVLLVVGAVLGATLSGRERADVVPG
jgi:membrane protein